MIQNITNVHAPESFATRNYYPAGTSIIFLFALLTDWYVPLSLSLFFLTIFMVVDRMGKGVVLREVIALHSLFVCLVMPIIGYDFYTQDNALAALWGKYMPVPPDQYFSYAVPAMAVFVLALCWPVSSRNISDHGRLLLTAVHRAKNQLSKMPRVGIYIILIGVLISFVSPYLPVFLQFVGTLLFWSSFAGVLYLFYTPHFKYKSLILWVFAFFILGGALQNGMFTLVAYMGITLFSFFFLGRRVAFWKKMSFFIVGCFLLVVLQNVKGIYRNYLWGMSYEGNKGSLFGSILVDRLSNSSSLFSQEAFFPFYYRANQGLNVALVIRKFSAGQAYDNGANLSLSLASSFVPRILWPDKPEAGGKFNMQYYTGITLGAGWSTNVGPLGEAYGSFGPDGGIIYMFFLGLFIRLAYQVVFWKSSKIPLLIAWLPVMFYQVTYSAETDSLQIFNSVLKSAFFIWVLVKFVPGWFGLAKNKLWKPAKRPDPFSPFSA